jgi:hypothetical protein
MSEEERSMEEAQVNEEGVDLTLIDWMLSLTPRERLMWLQRQVNAIVRMRDAAGLPIDPDDPLESSG